MGLHGRPLLSSTSSYSNLLSPTLLRAITCSRLIEGMKLGPWCEVHRWSFIFRIVISRIHIFVFVACISS